MPSSYSRRPLSEKSTHRPWRSRTDGRRREGRSRTLIEARSLVKVWAEVAVVVGWQLRELVLNASQEAQQASAEAGTIDAFPAVLGGGDEDDRTDGPVVLFVWPAVSCRGTSAALRPTRRKKR